ncbi:PREDICTED: neuromedin-U receptor 2-like isoform X2 [Trachymyrmex cornetzi]|uniref:Neuropeptides capa receptor n=1 Tax=Trachymyrmex cornetzi TaxID=471704 RepID=A0A151JSI6_9HYME|nr:PREDICTED: neuromedin-U receptor 2-like isoform X2 [Trachymyrmex cornetzi]KYN30205.1 Neuropeptides capa receptor [Trachymyrmex cornetzi]
MISGTIANITSILQGAGDSWRFSKDENLQELRSTIDSIIHANPRYENYSSTIVAFLRDENALDRRDSIYIVLPITVIYVVIFFTGLIGNISTCVVIARNKSMHTATNYYLFSLAVSDLLLLVFGLPPEIYYFWSNFPYVFGEAFCIIQSFASETSANATVLTITAFTIERYVAICHPFISHTMSKLSRAVKFVVAIWLLALCLAIPQAIQFGIVYVDYTDNGTAVLDSARCSLEWTLIEHAFEVSTILFFVLPMTIITVLYVLIAIKLRRSSLLSTTVSKRHHIHGALNHADSSRGKTNAQRNVIRMLVAVVVAFFICWAPFHAQRLLAVYAQNSSSEPEDTMVIVYTTLTYVSGVFYYLSTTVNPLLYNIMSNKFREAFKSMLPKYCIRKFSSHKVIRRQPTYSSLSRYQRSIRHRFDDAQHSPSISISDEQQRLTNIALANTNFCEPNGLVKSQNEREERPEIKETVGCRDYTRRVSRDSDCSQFTTMTTLSKQGLNNEGNNNANECLLRIQRSPKAVTLGILTERLGLGTKGFFAQHRKNLLTSPMKPKLETVIAMRPRFQSHPSIESANTMSNSSLQDFDETEFTGTESSPYMGELNFELVT